MVIIGMVFAAMYLKSFPTVFFYERELARYKRSSMSPEERWQRATVAQTFFLVLLAVALVYLGLQWWKSTPEPQPVSTPALLGMGGASVLATTAYLKVRTWRSSHEAEQPAIVSWCLPVPKHSPSQQQIISNLPDYCGRILAAPEGFLGSFVVMLFLAFWLRQWLQSLTLILEYHSRKTVSQEKNEVLPCIRLSET